jgi:phosphatidate phosphatase LPIN
MIGRDWTHLGVAKLYTDIVANGYHIMYLTSRSIGQADTTRSYLNGVVQDNYRLPKGPTILSPDRTIAALRREVYLRKPEVFKMACLRDIRSLFGQNNNPFYAGFGNRLTDALSYRSVNIPSTRIFTINSNAEVSLDLLTLNKYKSSYVSMREIVDHFFPPVGLLVRAGGESFTDFNYWRDAPLDLDDFSASESSEDGENDEDEGSMRSEDEGSEGLEDEQGDDMGDSFISRESQDEGGNMADSLMEDPVFDAEEPLEVLLIGQTEEEQAEAEKNEMDETGGIPARKYAKWAPPLHYAPRSVAVQATANQPSAEETNSAFIDPNGADVEIQKLVL